MNSPKVLFDQSAGREAVSTAGEAKPSQTKARSYNLNSLRQPSPTHQPTNIILTCQEWRMTELNIYQIWVVAYKLYSLRLNKYFYHNNENNSLLQSFTSNDGIWHGQEDASMVSPGKTDPSPSHSGTHLSKGCIYTLHYAIYLLCYILQFSSLRLVSFFKNK